MIKIISRILEASSYDKKFIKKLEEYLVVGKQDKKIGVVSDGNILNIFTPVLLTQTDTTNNKGYIQIPTSTTNIIIQWGQESITANSTQTYTFPIAFPNGCLQIVGSQQSNDMITGLMITRHPTAPKGNFDITINGGTNTEIISWIAIGY